MNLTHNLLMPPKMLPKTMDEITDILIDNDCELISLLPCKIYMFM